MDAALTLPPELSSLLIHACFRVSYTMCEMPGTHSKTDSTTNQHSEQLADVDAERLVRDNIGWMLALAQRTLGDRDLADDAVQNAFIAAFGGYSAFEGRSSIKTWLHRITINACLMMLRKQKRLAEQPINQLLPEFDSYECRIEAPWPRLASAEEILDDTRLKALVSEKIRELPERYRIVFQLRDIEGYNTSEVAELLDISVSNVKVRLHRARAALKKLLEPILRDEVHL
jgi:RNA polymerase sigma-70 factor (ECF subfamily)